jgi:hypothetical protein
MMSGRGGRAVAASWRRNSLVVLAGGLLGLVALGAIWSSEYGVSWDMARSARLGQATLRSYLTLQAPTAEDGLHDLARHGPAAVAITEWATTALEDFWPNRPLYQIRYFVQFLWFTLGAAVFYGLARRWVRPTAALMATALWTSQPLLFGHGFINPFDGPFATLFAAAMLAGYVYIDALDRRKAGAPPAAWRDLESDWTRARKVHRGLFLCWLLVFAALLVDLLFSNRIVYPVLEGMLQQAHSGTAWQPLNELFRRIAQDADRASFQAYQTRLSEYFAVARWVLLAVLALPGTYLIHRVMPRATSGFGDARLMAVAGLAGSVVGLASAARPIAPLAGILVTSLALTRAKYRGLKSLLLYWTAAAVVCYVSWPSLWSSPWNSAMAFLHRTALLPFNTTVLFAGSVSRPADLPWTYLPTFLLLQTTLPAIALAGLGAFLALRRKDSRTGEHIVTAVWLLLPIVLAVSLGTTLYDNGRHYLFLWTAGLLFTAVAIQWVLDLPLPKGISLGMVAAALLPGLLGIIRLHPYEYIYFNELVGGVRGAFRRYDLDYWATSYREAMGYVNRHAPPDAWIAVETARELFDDYARADLHLAQESNDAVGNPEPEFGIAITRANRDLDFFPDAPVVFVVEMDGATLAVVRDLR